MRTIHFALKQIIPLMFSYVFVGIAFGILMHKAGFSVIWSLLCAIFIYAGSMQLIMITLITSGVPLYMVALMTFFINARHSFYGIGFIDRFRSMGWKYPYMALTVTDETYSVLCSVEYPVDVDARQADFVIAASCHFIWMISCTIGALIGEMLPFDLSGIEFCAVAFFVTVVVNQWRQSTSHLPAMIGLISSILFFFILGPNNFLLPALSLSLVVLVILKDKTQFQLGRGKGHE